MSFVPDTVKQGYGTKWSFRTPSELMDDAPKGYKSRISRRFLEKYAERVKQRTQENFDARIQGTKGLPSKGDMPRSIRDAFEYEVVQDSKRATGRVELSPAPGYVYFSQLDEPQGETELITSAPHERSFYAYGGDLSRFKSFSPTKPVVKRGTAYFSDAFREVNAQDIDRLMQEAIQEVIEEGR